MNQRSTLGAARQLASSHLITSCAALAALFVFIPIGQRIVAAMFDGSSSAPINSQLTVAFLLNIAVILLPGGGPRISRPRWRQMSLPNEPLTTTRSSIT